MIDFNEQYLISDDNRYNTTNIKKQIIIGNSSRVNNYHITRLLHKDFGKTKTWNTYTISRDGTIYKHYDDKYHTDFVGIKEVDKQSISIVLENMCSLTKLDNGTYCNYINEVCEPDRIVYKEFFGLNYWEIYNEEQIVSLSKLCKYLCEKYNINKACIDYYHYHKDIAKFKGIVFKSNHINELGDINPLFDIQYFYELLNN